MSALRLIDPRRPDAHEVAFGPAGAHDLGELRALAGGCAARFAHDGGGQDRVVLCRDRLRFAAAALGAWSVGDRVILPSSPAPEALAALSGTPVHDDDVTAGPPLAGLSLPPDQVIAVLTTSGTTGAAATWPKTARQLVGEAAALTALLQLPAGARVLATVPPHHIYGLLFSLLTPLVAGASFSTDAPLFPEAVGARLAASGAAALITVPAHLRALVDTAALSGLRRVVSSGAPLPEATARALRDRLGVTVTEVLGSTETGGVGWRHQLDEPAWTPLPGVSVAFDGDRLIVTSPFLPDDRPLATNDRATPAPGGRFHHLGRLDDVVKLASKRVSLGAVEAALASAPGCRDHALAALTHDDRTTLHALVVADDLAAITAHLARYLDPVAIPRLHAVEAVPRDPTGKLPRARLDLLVAVRLGRASAWEEPVTVAADHRAFDGHFPGMPVLPGAAVVALLVEPAVRRAWPALGPPTGVDVLTFQRPILPGAAVTVRVERVGDAVRFRVDGPAGSHTTGALTYG